MATESSTIENISVEEKLKALYELQRVYSKMDEVRLLRGELPLEVQDLEDEITGLQTRLENFALEITNLETEISSKRVEIEEARMKIAKYKDQQENVRNSREYDNLSKEIEYQELEIELCEKRIREFTAVLQTRQDEKARTITYIEERKLDLNQKKAELNEIITETKQEEEVLREKAKEIESKIVEAHEELYLNAFKRIRLNSRNGLAVVSVERDSCGGCFNKIPAQRQLDIRLRKKVIVCEYCGRILIDHELANEQNTAE